MQFVDKVRTLYITMPFTDAITQIPTYAQFMKEIMSGKRKIEGTKNVALSEECSAATHQPMPPKLQDSGSFSIPCDIGGIIIRRALCDLGASVSIMPYSMYAKLKLGEAPVFPTDFIVMDISENVDIPIILGRPFLYTAKAVIDMDRGSLALRVGSERVVFDLPDMSKNPSMFVDCDKLDSTETDNPISLTSIEPCRVLQDYPIPMNICVVSTEGAAKTK
ncbi:unnamed protein product [Rhodiola kirilowii]